MTTPTPFRYNDGGRKAAGYKGAAGDCACRAIAIAAGLPYQVAYDLVDKFGAAERPSKQRAGRSSARTGVHGVTMRRIMEHLGWEWVPTMGIGTGCTVHLAVGELPGGRLVANVSKHFVAVIDGVVHDTHDPTRDGTRCVYGYWLNPTNPPRTEDRDAC